MRHVELGLEYALSPVTHFSGSFFQDQVENRYLVAFAPTPGFINFGTYRIRGTELTLRHRFFDHWEATVGATLLSPTEHSLPMTARRALNFSIHGNVGKTRLSLDSHYQSETVALSINRLAGGGLLQRVAPYTLVNARVAHPVEAWGQKGEVFLMVQNLLDRRYSLSPGYSMPDRTVLLGVSVGF